MNNNFQLFESTALRERYYRYIHPSGLPIYLFPKKLSSTYAIFGTRYGSIDNYLEDADGNRITVPDGIAHFLEHKLFTNEDGSDSFERFSALGADANAYTSFNKTAYLFSCTMGFEASLAELIDFVTHPFFTEDSVKKEIGIISQEIDMYRDSPSDVCYYGMLEGLYESHAIRKNICGSQSSISKITPELLYECHKSFYSLSNMALIVVGDVEPDVLLRVADEHLPAKSEGGHRPTCREEQSEPPSAHSARVEKKMKLAKPIFNIGIKDTGIPRDPTERQRKDAAMSILDEMLFSRAEKFYSELFESGTVSPDMSYGYTISSSFAFNSIAGEADDPELVLQKLKSYIAKLKENGLSRAAFERGKKVMYAEFVKEFDSTESIANNLLGFIFDDADIFGYLDLVLSVTFEEVCALFEECFKDEFFTMSVVYPLEQ